MDAVRNVIEVTGSSHDSWERAAMAAVVEASETLSGPLRAEVLKHEIVIDEHGATQFLTTVAVGVEIDLREVDDAGNPVKRYVIVANQTLASPALEQLVHELDAASSCRFHVVVPQVPTALFYMDHAGLIDPTLSLAASDAYAIARQEAENRLNSFRQLFDGTDADRLTGEVVVGDPLQALRRVMDRSRFDEIIVSTLPAGVSKWLKMDLPHRIERSFDLPVTSLVQQFELLNP